VCFEASGIYTLLIVESVQCIKCAKYVVLNLFIVSCITPALRVLFIVCTTVERISRIGFQTAQLDGVAKNHQIHSDKNC